MGILANSVSVTHASSTSDDVKDGYLNQERITLTFSTSASSYAWALSKPTDSGGQSFLSDDDSASVSFIPDVAGYYSISCLVDGTTTYILRVSVTDTVASTVREAMRFQPKLNAQIATPSSGAVMFFSIELDGLAVKDAAGVVAAVTLT